MGKYAQIRDLKDGKERVTETYASAIKYFSEEFGIPENQFPKLRFVKGEKMSYNPVTNEVKIGREEFIYNIGEGIGEELGHYIRTKVKGRVGKQVTESEAHTDEFFGFLGSRLLYTKMNPQEKANSFGEGEPNFKSTYEGKSYEEMRREIVNRSKQKGYGRLKRLYYEAKKRKDKVKSQEYYTQLEEAGYGRHVSNLLHVRPYHFASDIDLSSIADIKRVYSLSDRSVRRRFFRENKLYDIDKGIKRAKKDRGLEGKLGAGFLVIVFSLILISREAITGNAILENVNLKNSFFGIYGLIIIVCLIIFYRFALKKYKR
ncbi:hypothetical protein FJZ17_01965 [Candidatus Pacearchaeota archaeon]|nr:hypothetical protein [Candidatus Pacearchaeota archaeon]